ncbi:Transposon TX1 uncharacterized 149 kDa protein [Linum perenne]
MGSMVKRFQLKDRFHEFRPSIFCIQESKLEEVDDGIIRSIVGGLRVQWVAKPAFGSAGGIITIWKSDLFELEAQWTGEFCVVVLLKNVENSATWLLVNVYGPCLWADKQRCVEELRNVILWWDFPVCLVGDFNMIRRVEDARGLPRDARELDLFNNFVDDLGLLEMPLRGADFTWTNGRLISSFSRIDRVFFSASWEEFFPGCTLTGKTRTCSDHCPLLIQGGSEMIVKRPWRLEVMWFSHADFIRVVMESWYRPLPRRFGLFAVALRLKRLKGDLSKWNREVFKKVEVQIARVLDGIKKLDVLDERRALSEEGRILRCRLKCTLLQVWKQEYVMWKQRSREKWVLDGDRNTRFFQQVASHNRRCNRVEELWIEGRLVQGHRDLLRAIPDFYMNLYSEESLIRPFPQAVEFDKLSSEEAATLIEPFSEEEVWKVIAFSSGDKAPGPDGFHMSFFKKFWSILKGAEGVCPAACSLC